MKSLIFSLCLMVSVGGLNAENATWQPAPGHTQIPLWPGAVPDPQPDTGPGFYPKPAPYRKSGPYPRSPVALEDAQRAIGLVRLHAAEWKIDPHKIGVLGFSAGGHLVAATSTHFDKRLYPAVDSADQESCRPDFAVALYPGHLWNWNYEDNPKFELNPPSRSRERLRQRLFSTPRTTRSTM